MSARLNGALDSFAVQDAACYCYARWASNERLHLGGQGCGPLCPQRLTKMLKRAALNGFVSEVLVLWIQPAAAVYARSVVSGIRIDCF